MSDRKNDQAALNLSDDARRAADDFVDRITSDLLLRSRLYAEARGSHVVERPDVYRASREFELPAGPPRDTRNRRAAIYSGAAGLAASALLGFLLVQGGLAEADNLASAMGALVGAMGAALSVTFLKKGKRAASLSPSVDGNLPAGPADAGELIAVWRDIERMIRDDIPEERRKVRHGVGILVPEFAQRHSLGTDFVEKVRSLLQVRNRIVHDAGETVTKEEIADSLREAQRVASLVRGMTGPRNDVSQHEEQ